MQLVGCIYLFTSVTRQAVYVQRNSDVRSRNYCCRGKPEVLLERVCSQTQLCQLRYFNDYTRQLHVSAPTGHLQVVFKRT